MRVRHIRAHTRTEHRIAPPAAVADGAHAHSTAGSAVRPQTKIGVANLPLSLLCRRPTSSGGVDAVVALARRTCTHTHTRASIERRDTPTPIFQAILLSLSVKKRKKLFCPPRLFGVEKERAAPRQRRRRRRQSRREEARSGRSIRLQLSLCWALSIGRRRAAVCVRAHRVCHLTLGSSEMATHPRLLVLSGQFERHDAPICVGLMVRFNAPSGRECARLFWRLAARWFV